ncbi:MAG: DUF485 domain-containing protein [Gammaproteobacteria bacterium]|nr:DUF485 domain-containing protein [Gammaproteobacteria bacterium]MBU1603527.1 DUF485 domain-containing protein [Gammaproteobacteria bacterium]MBU2432324.1 DUF485 domain-containing protein [Gammaproteobacteria bacterium]MBU2447666.1 DUF485 domain-containing protein [Gammaproteobacteria bacterium]
MSQPNIQARIRSNPKFAEMVGKRTRFAIILSFVVLVPYYSFMMITAFNPAWLAQPISEGSIITLGWPIGVFLVVGAWLTTGIYISRANGEFDALNEQILRESAK